MQSYIIEASTESERKSSLNALVRSWGVQPIDIVTLTVSDQRQSIGIDETRQLLSQASYLPVASPVRAVVIDQADVLTEEAQQSLLKSLEEPPDRTRFVLCLANREHLLPTILSRCQVLISAPDQLESTTATPIIRQMTDKRVPDALAMAASAVKDRAQALQWIDDQLHAVAHVLPHESHTLERHIFSSTTSALLLAKAQVGANVTFQLVFDGLFLSLQKIVNYNEL